MPLISCILFFLFLDQTALIALRCLGLLFIATKTKRADGDIPFVMNFVPVGMHGIFMKLCII